MHQQSSLPWQVCFAQQHPASTSTVSKGLGLVEKAKLMSWQKSGKGQLPNAVSITRTRYGWRTSLRREGEKSARRESHWNIASAWDGKAWQKTSLQRAGQVEKHLFLVHLCFTQHSWEKQQIQNSFAEGLHGAQVCSLCIHLPAPISQFWLEGNALPCQWTLPLKLIFALTEIY